METIVNILPLSHKHDPLLMRERVLAGIGQLTHASHWHGRRLRLRLRLEDDVLTFSGGRYRLSPRNIHFVTIDFDITRRNEEAVIEQWAAQFHQLILVVDAKELMESDRFRHEVVIRRLALPAVDRHSDVLLLLMDVDNIMTIAETGEYATTYLGMSSAFADKPYNASRLHPEFQQVWDKEAPLYLAQRQLTGHRRFSHQRVAMPQQLVCHTDQLEHAGYKELITACLNQASKAHSIHLSYLSTLQTYNIMPDFNIQKSDFLSGLFNRRERNRFRLAVIGATASGKSYFLIDAISALQKMGFTAQTVPGYPSAEQFLNYINDYKSGVGKTPIYACRPTNQFVSKFIKGNSAFLLDFVDIPGEVVTKGSISEFFAILRAMSEHQDKIFNETTWKIGSRTWKTIEFCSDNSTEQLASSTVVPDDNHDGITLSGAQSTDASLLKVSKDNPDAILNNGGRTLAYQTNEVAFEQLRKKNGKVVNSTKVSGQYILEHLEEYVTDTVINAIIDAWETMDIDSKFDMVVSENHAGFSPNDSNKERFSKFYKNHFYFHYYTFFATDIVICDKCCLPQEVFIDDNTIQSSDSTFWEMIGALKDFLAHKDIHKKNLYLAFKGMDAVMKDADFKGLLEEELSANELYSLFVAHLFASRPSSTSSGSTGRFGYKKRGAARSCLFEDLSDFCDSICGEEQEFLKNTYSTLYDDFVKDSHSDFIKEPSDYTTISKRTLFEHLDDRMKQFTTLPMTLKTPNTNPLSIGKRLGGVPPHTFFTATPIDDKFNICSHDSTKDNKLFTGRAANPGNRICFGTRQLVTDILLQHGVELQEQDKNFGKILSYFYDNKKPK